MQQMRSLLQFSVLALVLAGSFTGCAGRREPGFNDKDGAAAVTRPGDPASNYGTSNSSLDRQADENKLDLMRYKKSF